MLGAEVQVVRNDAITVAEARALGPSHLVISPGPGRPEHAGQSCSLVEAFLGVTPVLGVCLGHQALAVVLGATMTRAPAPVHGKSSEICHDGKTLFAGLPRWVEVGRYHSLVPREDSLPDALEVTARTKNHVLMGIRHRDCVAEGVQFHPESVLTPRGPQMLRNFLLL